MSLSDDKTVELWRSFMPKRKEIKNIIDSVLYSVQVYGSFYFEEFSPDKVFEKWAAVEVKDFDAVPGDMETCTLPGGLYAVFLYKGSSADATVFRYIFTDWLPDSGYALDGRPHFEILGEKYKNEDPDSEEEIWIPIKPKR